MERIDINASAGATNIIDGDEFFSIVEKTCTDIFDVLKDHCGPGAGDALLIRDNSARSIERYSNIFTKDGIDIVNAVEYVSPIQVHVKDLIAYVGSRVDSVSHDGTTTAMMVFTAAIINALQVKSTLTTDVKEFANGLVQSLKKVDAIIRKNTITKDDLSNKLNMSVKEAKSYIAYQQSMISSKGDEELSSAVVKYIEALPIEFYGQYLIGQTKYETEERFIVSDDEFNFRFPCIADVSIFNHNLFTEYYSENCNLIVIDNELVPGTLEFKVISKLIEDYHNNDDQPCDIVIIAKRIDSQTIAAISNYNKMHEKKIVYLTLAQSNEYSGISSMLTAVLCTAGIYRVSDNYIDRSKPFIVPNVKIHYKNRNVHIYNLYDKIPGSEYHPFFTNPDIFLPYTNLTNNIKKFIDDATSGRIRLTDKTMQYQLDEYMEIYRRMVCANVRQIEIAGRSHDVLADYAVLKDAIGASLSSIEHGFMLDGLSTIVTELKKPVGDNQYDMIIAKAFASVLRVIHSEYADKLPYLDDVEDIKYAYRLRNTSHICMLDDMMPQLLIQPSAGYLELTRRLIELLPKIICTNKAIIPNTINYNKE